MYQFGSLTPDLTAVRPGVLRRRRLQIPVGGERRLAPLTLDGLALVGLDRELALTVDIPQVRNGAGNTRSTAGDLDHDFGHTPHRTGQLGDLLGCKNDRPLL